MHGNVWEWVQDCWHGNYNGAPDDGSAWAEYYSCLRVARGGGWRSDLRCCRSATRIWPDALDVCFGAKIGFRLVREQ